MCFFQLNIPHKCEAALPESWSWISRSGTGKRGHNRGTRLGDLGYVWICKKFKFFFVLVLKMKSMHACLLQGAVSLKLRVVRILLMANDELCTA
jgi:hypothetical protein